jgi:GNAT superfamily N-acetyltransferase
LKDALQQAVTYAPPAERDQKGLRAMARQSFFETFAHLYEPGPFSEFLDCTYGANGAMDRDLNDPAVQWLVAFYQSEPVGYAKLTPLRAPAPSALAGAVELQQIYVLSEWHGRGVAAHLMEWALATAADDDAPEVYLTVFDHNERAKQFYRRYGFAEAARCTFTLGDRVDDDRVWRLSLRPPFSYPSDARARTNWSTSAMVE